MSSRYRSCSAVLFCVLPAATRCPLTWQCMQRPRQLCVSFDMYRTNVVSMRMLSARIARAHVVYADSVRPCKLASDNPPSVLVCRVRD